MESEKVENLNKEEKVTVIAGMINATGKMLYWKSDIELEIGDYAVVQNMQGYDLIKIIGKVETYKKSTGRFSMTSYENMKKVLMRIEI